MKRLAMIIMAALAVIIPAAAQHHKEKDKDREAMRREVQEFKLKFLAQEMDLKEDQQKQFVEVYNQMSEEKGKVFRETKALEKKLQNAEKVSDTEYESVSKAITAAKERDAAIDKKYDEKFAQFLTPKQIFKMKGAEEKFREKMREMRHSKKNRK